MQRFTVDAAEVFDLSDKLTRAQIGLWVQLQSAIARKGKDGLISMEELMNQPVISHRDIPTILDAFCRNTNLLQALDKEELGFRDEFTNRQVFYVKIGELLPLMKQPPKKVKKAKKVKVVLSPQQEVIKKGIINCFPQMKITRLDEAIVKWQEAYPGMNLLFLAKEAELWAFNRRKKHKDHIRFLGNWYQNQTKYGTFGKSEKVLNPGVNGVKKI